MKSDKHNSHSHFPAKRRATNPDDAMANFKKDVTPHHLSQPQMQQSGEHEQLAQQGDSNFVRDQNVGAFG